MRYRNKLFIIIINLKMSHRHDCFYGHRQHLTIDVIDESLSAFFASLITTLSANAWKFRSR